MVELAKSELTRETIAKMAKLAHISLEPQELEAILPRLTQVLRYFEGLAEVALPPPGEERPLGEKTRGDAGSPEGEREDLITASLPPEAFLPAAPSLQGFAFKVPPIIE